MKKSLVIAALLAVLLSAGCRIVPPVQSPGGTTTGNPETTQPNPGDPADPADPDDPDDPEVDPPPPFPERPPEPVYPEGPAYYEPPTAALGAGNVYDIGPDDYGNPGRTYLEIQDFSWLDLVPGDVVRIHHRTEPYRGFIFLRARGTEEAPVKIYGVAGPGGELPVISGEDAIMSQAISQYAQSMGIVGLGLVVICGGWNEKPTYIELANLDIRDASIGNQYNYYDGTAGAMRERSYSRACGIWLKAGNVSILGCRVHNNNEGIFSQANSDLIGEITSDLLIQGSHIYYNGTLSGSVDENGTPVNFDLDHNLYIQSAGAVVEFCRIGTMRPTSGGSALKDRSSGTIIRYNFIESGARLLDLVEPEDTGGIIENQTTFVYGNILVNDYDAPADVPKSSALIHYGFDNVPEDSRRGSLHFYCNSVFLRCSEADEYRIDLFEIGREDGIVEHDPVFMYGNLVHMTPGPTDSAYFNLFSYYGDIRVGGGNWIADWGSDRRGTNEAGGLPYVEDGDPVPVWGTVTLIDSAQPILTGSDPGFEDPGAYDFRLRADSALRAMGTPLPPDLTDHYPVQYQYREGAIRSPRSTMACPGALE